MKKHDLLDGLYSQAAGSRNSFGTNLIFASFSIMGNEKHLIAGGNRTLTNCKKQEGVTTENHLATQDLF